MVETIRRLLADAEAEPLFTGVPRRLRYETVKRKAFVCIGVRRCGKSTFLNQIMSALVGSGVPRPNLLYLNFFDDRLHGLTAGQLDLVLEAYFSLHPEKKGKETVHCFFDEIQTVKGFEPFVDRILRTERCDVYLTGSSATMLSREIATQMRGRSLSWELFPFSFREFLDSKGITISEPVSSRDRLIVQNAFDEYWERGGFPEVLDASRALRIRIHQEYLSALLFRDVIERHNVQHPAAVVDLAHRLLENVASLHTVNSLTGHLKAIGHATPKMLVSSLLDWFEDAFFLFQVKLHHPSLTRRNANPKKIYCVDHALVASTSPGIVSGSGHLLENMVFVALRRTMPAIYYHRTRNGREVDFAFKGQDGKLRLVQVCESLAAPETKDRELAALKEAAEECGAKSLTIVTRREAGQAGPVRVVPAWQFLLETESEKQD